MGKRYALTDLSTFACALLQNAWLAYRRGQPQGGLILHTGIIAAQDPWAERLEVPAPLSGDEP